MTAMYTLIARSALSAFTMIALLVPVVPAHAQAGTTPTPQVALATTPDRCEPNDSLLAPCALQTEVDQTDLNFVDGSVDVYSFLFKAGRVYVVSASSTDGIDPSIRVFLAGATDAPIATNDDVAAGTTNANVQVAVPTDGWYILEVTNRAPGAMQGKTYRVSARSSTATTAPTESAAESAADILENNYDVAHAARIAWGVPYDLTLQCPDPRPDACFAGDHDFLLVPVKQGVPFIALTYDLGPGADTVVTLYAPDTSTQAAANQIPGWRPVVASDDIVAGRTLRSQVLHTPTWTGDALLIIAESERRNPPVIPSALGPAGRYRLIVGSPNMEALQTVLAAQDDLLPSPTVRPQSQTTVPSSSVRPQTTVVAAVSPVTPQGVTPSTMVALTPTPSLAANPTSAGTSAAAPAPAASDDDEEIIREDCTTGLAVVARESAPFYSAANPASERRLLTTYPNGTEIILLGSCYIGWVKAQPAGSVTPGWMFAPDLTLIEGLTPPGGSSSVATTSQDASSSASRPASARPTVSTGAAATRVQVVRAPAPTAVPVPTSAPAQAGTMKIRVQREQAGVAGVAVQLVDAYGTVLSDAVSNTNGEVVFTFSVQPNTALRIHVPTVAVTVPVDLANPQLTITLPGGTT